MMWRSLLLAVWPLCHASDQCSNCQDGHTLLQVQNRVKPRSPLARNTDPSSLLESVRGLALSIKYESPAGVPVLVDSITSMLNETKPLLQAEHDVAQSQLDAQFNEIKACAGSESHGVEVVQDLARQVAEVAAAAASSAAATATKETTCETYTTSTRTVVRVFPPPLGDSPTVEEIFAYATAWKNFVELDLPALETSRTVCTESTAGATAAATRLDLLRSTFNATFCAHQLSCTLLHACSNHEIAVYDKLTADTRSAMTARQEQFRTIAQVECLLGLITTAVQTNSTLADEDMNSCDDDAAADHLALSIATPDTLPACPPPDAGDPECPEVVLPPIWSNGTAMPAPPPPPPPPPPVETAVSSGFEYYQTTNCATGPGYLKKITSGRYGHWWNCVGFDSRTDIMPSGSGAEGISFQCTGSVSVVIGLQQAGFGATNPSSSKPETWAAASNGNFKAIYDAIQAGCGPDDRSCPSSVHTLAFDAGFNCAHSRLYAAYGNNNLHRHLADVSEDSVLKLMVNGKDFEWYIDGVLKLTETGVSTPHRRNSNDIEGPLWVVAAIQNKKSDDEAPFKNLQYVY